MDWEAIGAVGEIVGAVGVIASLLFLEAPSSTPHNGEFASIANRIIQREYAEGGQ